MNLIIWLVVGGVIGWLASLVMKTDAQQGMILNVVVGIFGALLGGWLLSPLLGAGTVNQGDFSPLGLLVSFGGAIILLFVVNLLRRGAARLPDSPTVLSGKLPPGGGALPPPGWHVSRMVWSRKRMIVA